ncbi:hypothetical protein Q31b_16470 [Novipirellula aureliae]|uniref:TraB family protein n=1 Tax=Novipirellula aureliae TaxID=2527966 RepID=A0A5C6E595_9BACT|nr:hypothetical protein [Novipirellula aureliae]TWU44112.1 hypothetical protein Q31b_16470 [Novipirellula aureliae]
MKRHTTGYLFFVLLGEFLFVNVACAQPPAAVAPEVAKTDKKSQTPEKTERSYLRVDETEEGKSRALQTAIVQYVGKPGSPFAGQEVDLVGVVHIGQAEYYQELKKRLATYDTVLYELVAPDGTRIRPEDLEKRRSILASMQSGMKDMLNLEYQLEKIDYMATNFRHADMSPEEFAKDFNRRGDSIWKMGARMMGAGMATNAANGGEAGLLLALFSDDRARRMKQVMARQMVDIDTVTAGMSDENGEDTLIQGRNAKAFGILRDELEQGKKRVAVFYGAGHLLDMAKRLEKNFEMTYVKTEWLDGWDLTRN